MNVLEEHVPSIFKDEGYTKHETRSKASFAASFMPVSWLAYTATLRTEMASSSKMSVEFQQITWCYISQECILHNNKTILDLCTRWRWVFSFTPWGKELQVPIWSEAGRTSELVCTLWRDCQESNPNSPAHSPSICHLSCPIHGGLMYGRAKGELHGVRQQLYPDTELQPTKHRTAHKTSDTPLKQVHKERARETL
jgi:hypothetical protein